MPPKQHSKKVSIGNAASLFGGGEGDDIFSSLGPSSDGTTPFQTVQEGTEEEEENATVSYPYHQQSEYSQHQYNHSELNGYQANGSYYEGQQQKPQDGFSSYGQDHQQQSWGYRQGQEQQQHDQYQYSRAQHRQPSSYTPYQNGVTSPTSYSHYDSSSQYNSQQQDHDYFTSSRNAPQQQQQPQQQQWRRSSGGSTRQSYSLYGSQSEYRPHSSAGNHPYQQQQPQQQGYDRPHSQYYGSGGGGHSASGSRDSYASSHGSLSSPQQQQPPIRVGVSMTNNYSTGSDDPYAAQGGENWNNTTTSHHSAVHQQHSHRQQQQDQRTTATPQQQQQDNTNPYSSYFPVQPQQHSTFGQSSSYEPPSQPQHQQPNNITPPITIPNLEISKATPEHRDDLPLPEDDNDHPSDDKLPNNNNVNDTIFSGMASFDQEVSPGLVANKSDPVTEIKLWDNNNNDSGLGGHGETESGHDYGYGYGRSQFRPQSQPHPSYSMDESQVFGDGYDDATVGVFSNTGGEKDLQQQDFGALGFPFGDQQQDGTTALPPSGTNTTHQATTPRASTSLSQQQQTPYGPPPAVSPPSRSFSYSQQQQQPQKPLARQYTHDDPYAPHRSSSSSPASVSAPVRPPTRSITTPFSEDPYAPAPALPQPPQLMSSSYQPYPQSTYDQHDTGAEMAYPSTQQAHQDSQQSSFPSSELEVRRNVPVVRFGFGGKLLVVFPKDQQPGVSGGFIPLSTGASPYSSSSTSPDGTSHIVSIRKIADITTNLSMQNFPGPLFGEGSKSLIGKKRKDSVAWLDAKIEELENEIQFFRSSTFERLEDLRKAQERLVLVKLVKMLLEAEGRIVGNHKADEAIRTILVPDALGGADITDADLPMASDIHLRTPLTPQDFQDQQDTIATYTVRASHLDKIQSFLLCGEKRRALKYALDRKLWAHAFVISGSIDQDSWREVATEFVRQELGPDMPGGDAHDSNGRESLRVVYNLFAGSGSASVQELLPPRLLSSTSFSTLAPNGTSSIRAPTPLSPNFPDKALISNLSPATLSKWRETAALIVANKGVGDLAALTSLGDMLVSNNRIDAAHVCYLLSLPTSPLGAPGGLSTRFSIVGRQSRHFQSHQQNDDLEGVLLTEIVEFALSLTPTVKGQEPYVGLPHLQAYRLLHALYLADAGLTSQASRYCDAIEGAIKLSPKASPLYNQALFGQARDLAERLAPNRDKFKSASWSVRNIQRPTLDSLWNTVEGRLTKFVAGEGDDTPDAGRASIDSSGTAPAGGQAIGPFSHYSSISPATTSASVSRQPSQVGFSVSSPSPGPQSNQAQSSRPAHQRHQPRSSSAGQSGYSYDPNAPSPWMTSQSQQDQWQSNSDGEAFNPASQTSSNFQDNEGGVRWWSATGGSSFGQSYPAPTFTPINEPIVEDSAGFISPMGGVSGSVTPARARTPSALRESTTAADLDDDDLGLGNTKLGGRSKQRDEGTTAHHKQENESHHEPSTAKPSNEPARPASQPAYNLKQTASSSWLGRWFRRDSSASSSGSGASTPIATKANLGEETSFFYDPQQKRWVNKKAGSDLVTSTAPPPPPRAATASPTAASRSNFGNNRLGIDVGTRSLDYGAPPKSASFVDLRSRATDAADSTSGEELGGWGQWGPAGQEALLNGRRGSLQPPSLGSPLAPVPPSPLNSAEASKDSGFRPPPRSPITPHPGSPMVPPPPASPLLGQNANPMTPNGTPPPVGKPPAGRRNIKSRYVPVT